MSEALAHRGPDDAGFYSNGQIGLSSRRLSIIDPVGGHQPVSNEDESVWLVFNGEIYNYQRLREKLERNGHRFRTKADTEVIVHLYEDYGIGCVAKLRGMFAFALWDEKKERLMLARDRVGQKPLYYARIGSDFIFASEQKAILLGNGFSRNIDFQALSHYLSLRFIPSPRTMFLEIEKLPPAHILIFERDSLQIRRYWSLSFVEKN
jgi:asparagine synthase (glutamine-hydrolysing)